MKPMRRSPLSIAIALPFAITLALAACQPASAPDATAPATAAPVAEVARPARQYAIEEFIESTGVNGASFNVDESRILFSSNKAGVWNVYSMPVTGGEWTAVTESTTDNSWGVSYFPADDRVLIARDDNGDELDHLYVIAADGSEKDLTPGKDLKADFLGFTHDGSAFHVISNERDPRFFDVYRYDAASYARELVYRNEAGFEPTEISSDGRWLALAETHTTNDSDVHVVELATGKSTRISQHEGQANFNAQAFSPDGQWLYYTANDQALPALPAGEIRNLRIARSENRLAFYLNGDRQPNDLYVLDIGGEPKQLTTSLNPAIDPADLVDSSVVRFKSFDGMEIPNILWKPHQATADAKAPALVWVHGGPGGQTTRAHSALIQYLANHGYVVLGINNRGSSGYGKTFFAADDGKHGREPLWDTIEAKKYLQSLDYVDDEKIGIVGGSYGGYMVLSALAFKPGEFKVGVDIFGVSNWVRTLESIPPYWESFREALYQEIGNPETQRDFLVETSPLFHADKIDVPLMVLQGANDPRVIKPESDEIVAAVQKNGVPVDYVVFDDEGHGFTKKKNQIEGYGRMLAFLDQHLKGGAAPASVPAAAPAEAAADAPVAETPAE
jgi:dipeptidyl aminopeptidase/acylaminoacyl peptidase